MNNLPQRSAEEDDPIFQDQGCLDAPLQDELPDQSESEEHSDDEDAAFSS